MQFGPPFEGLAAVAGRSVFWGLPTSSAEYPVVAATSFKSFVFRGGCQKADVSPVRQRHQSLPSCKLPRH
jgi:hypothetical protein